MESNYTHQRDVAISLKFAIKTQQIKSYHLIIAEHYLNGSLFALCFMLSNIAVYNPNHLERVNLIIRYT